MDYVHSGEMRHSHEIVVGNPEDRDWIDMSQNRYHLLVLLDTVMNLRV